MRRIKECMFGWSDAQEADVEWSVELSSGEGSASSPLVRWRGAVRWDMELSVNSGNS
jgi:hypothetical protein